MWKNAILALSASALFAVPVAAEPITIKLNSPAPTRSPLNKLVFEPWAEQVTKASEGSLKVQTFYGGILGGFRVTYDRVLDGVADIGFILTAMSGGKLKKADVAALPFESDNSTEASVALWNIFAKGVIANEFANVKLLGIWTFPGAAIHSKNPIRTLADVKGKKMATSNPTIARIWVTLGGTPVTFRPDEAYQAINRGIVSGAVMPFTGFKVFKLFEVTKYSLDAKLGSSPAMLFMNKASYAKLPAKAKQAIDKYSYRHLSKWVGEHNDREWISGRKLVKSGATTLAKKDEARWREVLRPVAEGWAKKIPDGGNVLKAFRAEIAAYRAKK